MGWVFRKARNTTEHLLSTSGLLTMWIIHHLPYRLTKSVDRVCSSGTLIILRWLLSGAAKVSRLTSLCAAMATSSPSPQVRFRERPAVGLIMTTSSMGGPWPGLLPYPSSMPFRHYDTLGGR